MVAVVVVVETAIEEITGSVVSGTALVVKVWSDDVLVFPDASTDCMR